MLKKLRKKKTSRKIWIILTFVIIVTFVFFGSGYMRSKKDSYLAGKIYGRNVSILEFKDALDGVRNQAVLQFGDKFTEVQKYLNLEEQAWERIILLQEAKKRKIGASDNEVRQLIASMPFFQRAGRFDNALYQEFVQYYFRVTPRAFEEETRENIIIAKLAGQVTGETKPSEEELREGYRKSNEEISINYIAGLPQEFAKNLAPTEEETARYFKDNAAKFRQPVAFNLDYIVLDSEDKIKEAGKLLEKQTDLKKLASQLGVTVQFTGLFSPDEPIPGIGWSQELLSIISKLNAGETSPFMNIDKKYIAVRLKEKKESYLPEFERVKEKARLSLIRHDSEGLAKEKIDACLDKLKDSKLKDPKSLNLAKTAQALSLKYGTTPAFKSDGYIEGIGGAEQFWTAAKDLKEGEFSGVISAPSGFYIISLKSRTAFNEQDFQSQKPQLAQKLSAIKQQKDFADFIAQLKQKAGFSLE